MNLHPAPTPTPLPPVPGVHPDDDSVAGEEDPGASLEELPKPTTVPKPLTQHPSP
jgi:hypothetical protein